MKRPPEAPRCALGLNGFTPRASAAGQQPRAVTTRNGSNCVMDVTCSIATGDGARGARLGSLAPGRSRSVHAECGATVTAQGRAEGITAQGSAVATPGGDRIVLRN